jgi:two-component system cell cycle sensor histidine kinase/response regulator CckA
LFSESGQIVLFCEDDDSVRSVTRKIIERAGYQVHAAPNGSRALGILDELDSPIDILITDVVMPEMSGPDLAIALRDKDPSLKVFFISGFTAEHAPVVAEFGSGAVFLPKPYTSSTLLRTIDLLLSQ